MRVRLAAHPPLPDLKIWHSVPLNGSIFDLKKDLCSTLHVLVAVGLHAEELVLDLDGFELLDESAVDILREGDLLGLKQNLQVKGKRKAQWEAFDQPTKRHKASSEHRDTASRKIPPPPQVVSDSDSSSSGSDSDTTTSSSSDSASSESDSDSDTDSSSEAGPPSSQGVISRDKMLTTTESSSRPITAPKGSPLVPPGQGKTSTHKRNQRRRLKRLHEKYDTAAPEALLSSSSVNGTPLGLGHRVPSSSTPHPTPSNAPGLTDRAGNAVIMSSTLRNKNKKRGFARSMAEIPAQRIVFAMSKPDADNVIPDDVLPPAADVLGAPLPRLIPPSERQDRGELPMRMFVTSVDVEADLWASKGRKKGKQRLEEVRSTTNFEQVPSEEEDAIVLDYGQDTDPYVAASASSIWDSKRKKKGRDGFGQDINIDHYNPLLSRDLNGATSSSLNQSIDWERLEKEWGQYQKVGSQSELSKGSVVAWKELALNPATFMPELLIHAACVVHSSPDTEVINVMAIPRPGSDSIAFGMHRFHGEVNPDSNVQRETGEGIEDGEDVEYRWANVLNAEWRVIKSCDHS